MYCSYRSVKRAKYHWSKRAIKYIKSVFSCDFHWFFDMSHIDLFLSVLVNSSTVTHYCFSFWKTYFCSTNSFYPFSIDAKRMFSVKFLSLFCHTHTLIPHVLLKIFTYNVRRIISRNGFFTLCERKYVEIVELWAVWRRILFGPMLSTWHFIIEFLLHVPKNQAYFCN